MENLRLFDRINCQSKASSLSPSRTAVDSVVEHLRRMLNSRQGSTLMNPSYGMPDFSDLRAEVPDSVSDIEALIAGVIRACEPRLSQIAVKFMYQDEQRILYFQIQGFLATDREKKTVYLESSVDTFGKMAVRG